MSIFYENYVKLCNGKGKSPSGVALEIGLSKTAVNGWKHGRSNPTDATAQKVAEYFGITVEELLGENEQKEKPAISEDDRLNAEFVELFSKLTEAEKAMMLSQLKGLVSGR